MEATASLRALVARLDLAVREPRSRSDGRMIKILFGRSRHNTGTGDGLDAADAWSPRRQGAGSGPASSAAMALHVAEDHDRIALGLNDIVIRRLFAAGLDLQTVLELVSDDRVADLINHTIGELDQAIRDIQDAIFNRHGPAPDAVDR